MVKEIDFGEPIKDKRWAEDLVRLMTQYKGVFKFSIDDNNTELAPWEQVQRNKDAVYSIKTASRLAFKKPKHNWAEQRLQEVALQRKNCYSCLILSQTLRGVFLL